MPPPLSQSDILFPYPINTPTLSSTLTTLKRSALSLSNRLTSILSDSHYVTTVSSAYALPLIANERCGSWYIPPDLKAGSVYFKSTDGHTGQWAFSLRRLNLQLLDVLGERGGAVVVDSTRRGKSMPDALSKSVPIWCCVVNRAVFGEGELCTPPGVVSASEHAQIEARIDGFVRGFLEICYQNIPTLRSKLTKPLRPIWSTHTSPLPPSPPSFPNFHPIVLCTASRRVHGAETSENGYIQGAADDHESWSHGLTPSVFWLNVDLLLSTREEDAPSVVAELLEKESQNGTVSTATLIRPTTNLYISSSQNPTLTPFNVVISCTSTPLPTSLLAAAHIKHYLPLHCPPGKLGSRALRTELPLLAPFLANAPLDAKILVCCPTGRDLSVGVGLAVLCMYADDTGLVDIRMRREGRGIDKSLIKQRLSWITTSNPALNPSRATLQSVNAVLLSSAQDQKATTALLPVRAKSILIGNIASSTPTPPPPSNDDIPPRSIPTLLFDHFPTTWSFHRTLSSTHPTTPSGTVTGHATFTPCVLPASFPPTLLYTEEGEFVTNEGASVEVGRKYVWQLLGSEDGGGERVVVRFFNDDDAKGGSEVGSNGEGIGALFVEMGCIEQGEARSKKEHLCGEDVYGATWRFGGGMMKEGREGDGDGDGDKGEGDMWWEVRYDVQGPRKEYVSETRYTKTQTQT